MRGSPKEGSQLGGYTLEAHLARGGMADIYVARSPLGHRVALKCIRPQYAEQPTFIDLFLREAQLSMELEHGNIARVFDFGEEAGSYFLVMEYVHGPALWDLQQALKVRRRPFPRGVAVHVMAETSAGLAHAHGRLDESGRRAPVVHRDISPQNILVALDGSVKVVDFGIAKARDSQDLTRPGMARGKYLYFSPEQVRQLPLDGKSDVYACGVVLYELLAGRRPFEGELIDVLGQIVRADFPPLLSLAPDLPAELLSVVESSLALEPADRPSAGQVEATLRGFLRQGVSTGIREPGEQARALVEECWDEDQDGEGSEEPTLRDDDPRAPAASSTTGARARLLGAGAAGVAVALALGAALFFGGSPSAPPSATRIESSPPGARIVVEAVGLDGVAPLDTDRLEIGHPYRVEASLEGFESSRRIVVGGDRLRIALKPRPKTAPPPPAELDPTEALPAAEGGQVYARIQPGIISAVGNATGLAPSSPEGSGRAGPWPLREVTLSKEKLFEAAARLPLNPRRPHRIRARGRIEVLSGFQPIHQVFFYAEAKKGVDRYGLLDARKKPLRLPSGYETLHVILFDPATARSDSPTMRDLVNAWPTGSLEVRTREGSVSLRFETQRAQLRKLGLKLLPLRGSRRVEIEVHLTPEPGRPLPPKILFAGFPSLNTFGVGDPEASAPIFAALGDGERLTVEHVNEIWVFAVDEEPERLGGLLTLDIRDVGPASKLGGEALP